MFMTVRAHMPRTMRISGPGGLARGAMACSSVTSAQPRPGRAPAASDSPLEGTVWVEWERVA
jgi:hypothetical protein